MSDQWLDDLHNSFIRTWNGVHAGELVSFLSFKVWAEVDKAITTQIIRTWNVVKRYSAVVHPFQFLQSIRNGDLRTIPRELDLILTSWSERAKSGGFKSRTTPFDSRHGGFSCGIGEKKNIIWTPNISIRHWVDRKAIRLSGTVRESIDTGSHFTRSAPQEINASQYITLDFTLLVLGKSGRLSLETFELSRKFIRLWYNELYLFLKTAEALNRQAHGGSSQSWRYWWSKGDSDEKSVEWYCWSAHDARLKGTFNAKVSVTVGPLAFGSRLHSSTPNASSTIHDPKCMPLFLLPALCGSLAPCTRSRSGNNTSSPRRQSRRRLLWRTRPSAEARAAMDRLRLLQQNRKCQMEKSYANKTRNTI